MFYIKYFTIHKVHMHAGAIRQSLYSCAYVREIIHSLKLVDYLPVHTNTPYKNLHIKQCSIKFAISHTIEEHSNMYIYHDKMNGFRPVPLRRNDGQLLFLKLWDIFFG